MSSLPSAPGDGYGYGDDAAFFHHPVSKLDTLAGLAIKYGVEVADIKKANGLGTDLQMFGYQTLKIPKPKEHPFPRSHDHKRTSEDDSLMGMENSSKPLHGIESSKTRCKDRRTFYTATMSLLRGHSSSNQQIPCDEGTEMTCYHSNGHDYSELTCLRKTMKTERSMHACGSNMGTRKAKEVSRVHNVYMPMTISVLDEISSMNKNRDVSERSHTSIDALMSSSDVETRRNDTLGSVLQSIPDFTEVFSSKVMKSPITSNSLAQITLGVNPSEGKSNNSSSPIS